MPKIKDVVKNPDFKLKRLEAVDGDITYAVEISEANDSSEVCMRRFVIDNGEETSLAVGTIDETTRLHVSNLLSDAGWESKYIDAYLNSYI